LDGCGLMARQRSYLAHRAEAFAPNGPDSVLLPELSHLLKIAVRVHIRRPGVLLANPPERSSLQRRGWGIVSHFLT
jgi:hypothetical protein